jgi:hypothetical protein
MLLWCRRGRDIRETRRDPRFLAKSGLQSLQSLQNRLSNTLSAALKPVRKPPRPTHHPSRAGTPVLHATRRAKRASWGHPRAVPIPVRRSSFCSETPRTLSLMSGTPEPHRLRTPEEILARAQRRAERTGD